MSNKPRFPGPGFSGSKRDDDEDDDKGRPAGSSPFNRSGDKPGAARPPSSPFGSRSPFGPKANDPDDDEDDDDDKDSKPSPFGGGNKLGSPARPGGSPFGGGKPADPPKSGSPFGGNKSADPPKPGGAFGSSKPSDPPRPGGAFGGNKPPEPAKSSSPFGGSKPADPPKPGGGSSMFGSKPAEKKDDKPADKKDDKPGGGSPFGGRLPFGGGNKPGDKPADKKDDKPAGGGPLGGRLPFGGGNKPGDKPADKKDDKPAGGGPLGGVRLPFGAKPGDKKDDAKKDDKPAGSPLGGLRLPGAKPGDKPADKKDDKPASGGPLGGVRLPFGKKPDDKPADKPAAAAQRLPAAGAKPGDKPAEDKPSGGLFGGRLPFGKKPDEAAKPDDKKTSGALPAVPSRPGDPKRMTGSAPAAAVAPPKPATAAPDLKKAGSKVPPARGDKVAKPLDKAPKQVTVQRGLSLDQKLDLVGYGLIILGVLIFFGIVQPSEGSITKGLADLLGQLFGAGRIVLPVPCLAIGLWLFVRHFNENPLIIKAHRAAGWILMYLTFVTTLHFIELLQRPVPNMAALIKMSDAVAKARLGGGWVGGELYKLLMQVGGDYGTPVLLVGFWLVAAMLAFSITLAEVAIYIRSVIRWFARVRMSYTDRRRVAAEARAAALAAKAAANPPLTIEKPAPAGAIEAGAAPAAALASPLRKPGIPERTGVPEKAAESPAFVPAAPPPPLGSKTAEVALDGGRKLASAPARPFGKVPARPVNDQELADEEAFDNEPAAPVARPAPVPLGARTTSTAAAVKPAEAKAEVKTEAAPEKRGLFGFGQRSAPPQDKPKPAPFGSPPGKPADDGKDADKKADSQPAAPAVVKPEPVAQQPADPVAPKPSGPFGPKPTEAKADEAKPAVSVNTPAPTVAVKAADKPAEPAANGKADVEKPAELAPKPATPFGSKPTPFGAGKPGGNLFAKPDSDDDIDADDVEADKPAAAPVRPATPFGSKPNPFGSGKPGGSAIAKPGGAVDESDEDEDVAKADKPLVTPVKPATPIGSKSPFGFGKPGSSPLPKPGDEDDADDSDALDKTDKLATTQPKPATPVASKPNPFGSGKPGGLFSKPGDDDTDEDEDAAKADKPLVTPVKPATPIGSKSPFGFGKPGSSPLPKPGEDDADDTDALDKTDKLAATQPKPVTPTASKPNPFGTGKPGGLFNKPGDDAKDADDAADDKPAAPVKPATPLGNKSPFGFGKPDDKGDADDVKDDKPLFKPATPVGGNRPNPFGAGKPTDTKADDRDDDKDDKPAFKPATPIGGSRPNPFGAPPSTPLTKPVPKSGMATPPPLDDEDEEPDDEPKYVAVDDVDELEDGPRPDGPRPTLTGRPGVPPPPMPRPANPVMGRQRPGSNPLTATGTTAAVKPGEPATRPTNAENKAAIEQPTAQSDDTATPAAKVAAPKTADVSPQPVEAKPSPAPDSKPAEPAAVKPQDAPKPAPTEPPKAESPASPPEGVITRSKTVNGWEKPDFSQLLERGSQQKITDEVLQARARAIEETLSSFGAPGKVVEINTGPVITQFGVEPDYLVSRQGKKTRVKVSAIARLDADLALSLAAKSIRIEAPVPGKGYVGIEVPNSETALVSLRDIMDSSEFQKMDSNLRIALGKSVDGAPIAADLTKMPHLLIAGTTGSGKSVCVNAIIACLLLENTPDDMKFIMVDPKRVELTGYNGIPHLVSPVVVDLERIVGVLKWVTREMEERYKKFSQAGARNITDFNSRVGPTDPKLPYLVVIIDELADLMMLAPEETEKVLTRLAQMARATGIHLIISTQRPSVDVVTGLIKANFPARISFAVASSVDSRVILDQPGAEKLLGRGDMLYQSPDAAAPLRMQGVFLSDAEINRITRYWKGATNGQSDAKPTPAPNFFDLGSKPEPVQSRGERFGSSGSSFKPNPPKPSVPAVPAASASAPVRASSNGSPEDDELYDEAVKLVKQNKASVQLLQRRLRVNYARASRLIELMKQRGVIDGTVSDS